MNENLDEKLNRHPSDRSPAPRPMQQLVTQRRLHSVLSDVSMLIQEYGHEKDALTSRLYDEELSPRAFSNGEGGKRMSGQDVMMLSPFPENVDIKRADTKKMGN